MKRLIIALVAVGLLAVPATAQARTSNTFTNPARNLRCQYLPYQATVTCMRTNDRKQLSVNAYRGRGFQVFNWPDPVATPFTPVLGYGQRYNATRLQCLSGFYWMACRSSSGHGFQIGRTILRTW